MREIKFRGKRILEPINIDRYAPNGWVYGGLIDCSDEMYILPYDVSGEMYIDRPYRFRANDYECRVMLAKVEPKSIGQYTGLKDKNGKEIYEGDIVRFSHPAFGKDYIGVVKWDENEVGFLCSINCYEMDNGLAFGGDFVEIIGNLWDNPELLEDNQ